MASMHYQFRPAQLCFITHVPECFSLSGCNSHLALPSPPGLGSGSSKSSSSLSSSMVLRWTPAGQISSLQAAAAMILECPTSSPFINYQKA